MDLGAQEEEEEVSGEGEMREKVRRTRGESSASTERAERAADARRGVGRGMSRVLLGGGRLGLWGLGRGRGIEKEGNLQCTGEF